MAQRRLATAGSWIVSGVNDQFNNAYGGTPTFDNNGSFVVQNPAGYTVIFSEVEFTNDSNPGSQNGRAGGRAAVGRRGYLNGGFQAEAGANISFDQVAGINAPFATGPNFLCAGAGSTELTGGTLMLGYDQAGLELAGGTVTLGPNFQSGGEITNLTLDGSDLEGTNTLAGTMDWVAGSISGVFVIAPGGVLNLKRIGRRLTNTPR